MKYKLYVVPSFTVPNKSYAVREFEDGEFRCSCPAFVLKERDLVICKHITKVIKGKKDVQSRKENKSMGASQKGTQR